MVAQKSYHRAVEQTVSMKQCKKIKCGLEYIQNLETAEEIVALSSMFFYATQLE